MSSGWTIKWEEKAKRELKRLDRSAQKRIIHYLETRIMPSANPRDYAEPLTGKFKGLWRYRIGNYRLMCTFRDNELLIMVVAVGHRKEIYH